MLKLKGQAMTLMTGGQPPSGGCVLKQAGVISAEEVRGQPPSGGCVLKLGSNT